jgi:tagaturonate epimerase
LALTGGEALVFVKGLWRQAFARREELCAPYAAVLDIDPSRLPTPAEVNAWDGPRFAAALRHDSRCPHYNPHFRQLLHVAFRIAAEAGEGFYRLLRDHRATLAREVTLNLLERHVRCVFPAAPETSRPSGSTIQSSP